MSDYCKDFPDVLVKDAIVLEVKLCVLFDDDEAHDATRLVLEHGWRPAARRETNSE